METKNIIIQNYARSLVDATTTIANNASKLTDNMEESTATIKTLNVLVESLRSQTVIFQGELDNYN